MMVVRNKDLPLHTKYRPQTLDEFVGNNSVKESLRTLLSRDTGEVRAFLFTGPSGCGKTTLGRIVANELKCSDQDFHEFNVASVRGIDTIREIASNSRYFPLGGKVKIYLLDECHKITGDGMNALLKLLEDPPKHVRLILCTTDPEKLIKTIRTRCTTFSLSSLKRNEIVKILEWICKEEKVAIGMPVLQKIAEFSDGSPRQAVVILDQIIDLPTDEEALETIQKLTFNETNTLELCQALIDPSKKWPTLSKIIKGIDEEPEKIRYAVLGYMAAVLMNSDNNRAAQIIQIFTDSWMYSGKAGLVCSCYMVTKL